MPSLLTPRSDNGNASSSRTLSRINSFKREWDDDKPKSSKGLHRGSSGAFEWSPSPERPSRPPPVMPDVVETAQEKRRRAILEAFRKEYPSPLADLPPATASTSIPTAQPTSHLSSTAASTIRALSSTTPQVLPELPSTSKFASNGASSAKKRSLPWEENGGAAKKMPAARNESLNSERSSKRSTSATSGKADAVNIRQKLVLSSEQQKVLQLVVSEGKNIFFTGSAGTGKSVLLREIIKGLKKKFVNSPDAVAVTASTGIAACNIGGITLHSFGGAGLAIEPAAQIAGKLRKNKKAASRWMRTKVLIMDEVSMVDAELFDKYNQIGQLMRRKPGVPFGGIQIVVTGDFFQLPPVTKKGEPKFVFEAQTWGETISMSVNLTQVFRQKDARFVDMLNQMRFGRMTSASIQCFRDLAREVKYDDGIEPTELFPRREEVDRANQTRLAQLNTDGWSYAATDGGSMPIGDSREKALSNFMAPSLLKLNVNAQVMLIKNVDETLVNGSMGIVIGFEHKALFQLDTTEKWVETPGPGHAAYDDDDEMRERADKIRKSINPSAKPYPVVRFSVPGGSRDMLVEPDTFKNELPNGEIQVSRSQLPLILAWAMSIHKSQGQTLDRVKVDLGKVFEKGQAYVALSRATRLEGLQVLNFRADRVMAHPKVVMWSKNLTSLEG